MDLNLYPPLGKKELMGVDAKLQFKVGYWASRNGFHDDKIYRINVYTKVFEQLATTLRKQSMANARD